MLFIFDVFFFWFDLVSYVVCMFLFFQQGRRGKVNKKKQNKIINCAIDKTKQNNKI